MVSMCLKLWFSILTFSGLYCGKDVVRETKRLVKSEGLNANDDYTFNLSEASEDAISDLL